MKSLRGRAIALSIVVAALGAFPRAAAAQEPAAAEECVPTCRTGFVCVHGACVSACNPPCATNETCSERGECTPAQAPPPAPAAAAPVAPAPPAPEKGAHTHDGFYFRIALGFGYMVASGLVTQNEYKYYDQSAHAAALISELAFGGTVAPGLVIGGGAWNGLPISASGSRKKLSTNGGIRVANAPEETVDDATIFPLGLVGAFADWYFDPTQGLHAQVAIGIATGGYKEHGNSGDDISQLGYGGMVGCGYEWWISSQWSIGALARLTVSRVSGDDPSDDKENHQTIYVTPGALVTFTYH